MTFLSRATCACVLLAALSGCAQTPEWAQWSSWFKGGSVAHEPQTSKNAEAPPPKAAPVPEVQRVPVPAQAVPTAPAALSTAKVRVGLLVPLSGPNAALGQAMLNAAQQAVYDASAANFELMPRDTGGDENSAQQAARDAIANSAQLIVGPLFAAQIPAVFKVAEPSRIPVLSLSTDTSLATSGLYIMGFAPEAQAQRVAHYAVSHGLRRFAAIVPSNTYGTLVGQAFQLAVAEDGATMVALYTYDPSKHNSDAAVRDLADKSGVIDAVFLPEGGADLALITKQLAGANIDPHKIRMLGTGLWDAVNTGRQAGFVVGGWFAAPDPALRQNFVNTYKSTYREAPPRLATLAYDATALAAVLAKRGAMFDQAALTNPSGFAGLDGIFRLRTNGEVERGLAILEVTPDGSRVMTAAPSSFASAR